MNINKNINKNENMQNPKVASNPLAKPKLQLKRIISSINIIIC